MSRRGNAFCFSAAATFALLVSGCRKQGRVHRVEQPPAEVPGIKDSYPTDQRNPPLDELALSGTPSGGTLTIGIVFSTDATYTETIQTYATDSLESIVSRFNTAINDSAQPEWVLETNIKQGSPTTLQVLTSPGIEGVFMRSTDTGLHVAPGVRNLAVAFDKANNTATVTWNLPTGVTYDKILVTKIVDDFDASELSGSTTTFTDSRVRRRSDRPWQELYLAYRVVGWKDGVPSDLAQDIVLRPLRIATPSDSTLPKAQMGVVYSTSITTSGGVAPITWKLDPEGGLPTGLALNTSTGEVAGTPTQVGTFYFGIEITDSQSPPSTAGRALSIEVW